MAQLRTLAALAEDPNSFLGTLVKRFTTLFMPL